jgi:hypothetical protein
MGKLLNFWNEDEAIDSFFYVYTEYSYENFITYLNDYAPWLLKHKHRIWIEINK